LTQVKKENAKFQNVPIKFKEISIKPNNTLSGIIIFSQVNNCLYDYLDLKSYFGMSSASKKFVSQTNREVLFNIIKMS